MVYPMRQHCEIARNMIAVGLPWACRVEVQTSVHVDNAGAKGSDGNFTRMRQHIVPGRECRRRNRIRCDLESTKSAAQQVDRHDGNSQKQNDKRAGQKVIALLHYHHWSLSSESRRVITKR